MEQLKVTRQICKAFAVFVLLFLCHSAFAASTRPASVLLQEGLYAEEVEGNLDEAIKIYQEVITASQQMEQSAAQATYRIALCYLKKGDTEQAAKQFSQLISKYPEQKSLVQEAQKQLKKISTPGFEEPVIVSIYNMIAPVQNYIDRALDLDNNKVMSIPDDKIQEDHSDNLKWLVDNGSDVVAAFQGDEISLIGLNIISETLSSHAWNELSVEELIDRVKDKKIDSTKNQIIKYYEMEDQPVYAFVTKNGSVGLLQIISFNPSRKYIELRYKKMNQKIIGQKDSSSAPVVINTKPDNFSNNVSPNTTEISVTFNKEMADKSWSWVKWNSTFPEITGQISYDKTKTTCTLPVKLEPGKAYLLRINAGQYSSFMSSDGVKAQPFVFVFSTLDSSGKPTPIPDEMLNFAKQINSAAPEKTYTQEFSAEITPDNILKFKGTIIQKNSSGSNMTTHSFVNSDNVNVTAMQDEKGQPLKFTANHNGNIFRYHVTLNEPVKAGEIFTYSTEGTMDGMILPVIGNENTYMFRMSHSPAIDRLTTRIETYLLPKGAELISMNPKDMKRTEKDGRIELRHEELIPVGGNIVTEFQYKLEK